MPPLGMAIGGVNFSDLGFTLGTNAATGEPVVLKYGQFLQTLVDFLIIAVVLFMALKAHQQAQEAAAPAAGAAAAAARGSAAAPRFATCCASSADADPRLRPPRQTPRA